MAAFLSFVRPGLVVSKSCRMGSLFTSIRTAKRRVEVILLKDHDKLGFEGETLFVKPGFHRNFLYPKQIAVYATPENKEKYGSLKTVSFET